MCTNKKNVFLYGMVCHYLAYFWMNILKFIDRFGSVQTARFLIICKFTNRRFSVSEFYLQELLLLFSKYTIGFVCRRNLQTKSSLIGLEMYKEQVLWLHRKFTDNKFPDCLENLHKAVIVPEMFSLSLLSDSTNKHLPRFGQFTNHSLLLLSKFTINKLTRRSEFLQLNTTNKQTLSTCPPSQQSKRRPQPTIKLLWDEILHNAFMLCLVI